MNTTRMHIEKEPGFFNFNDESFKHFGMGDRVAQASISRLFRDPTTGNSLGTFPPPKLTFKSVSKR